MLGPFDRRAHAHLDETRVVADLMAGANGSMIDVGAHQGSALAPFIEAGWRVLAFEPDPANRTKLLERFGHLDALIVDERACTNAPKGKVDFFTSEVSTGISGLSAFHDSHRRTVRVETTSLRDACNEHGVERVDFLKVDTEGFDLFVLQGHDFERLRPRVIECEFEDAKTGRLGYEFHDLARHLVDIGYEVFVSEWHPVIEYGRVHDWRAMARYPCRLHDERAWGNLLAFDAPVDVDRVRTGFEKALTRRSRGLRGLARRLADR